eukprot:TRINITY_DN567_c0_g1_i1.p1 TRINITY_DN567_c0_g1~~TRINITY_DN567_c0_g1_i1.p1  ORF type:complete len:488 (+),score=90.74 TRINITY_DN567_c0_g1_i1:6383-7846(+)
MLVIPFLTLALLAQSVEPRLSLPDSTGVDSAKSRIREVLAPDFKEAKNAEGKTRLAEKLVGRANDSKESPTNRYAFFIEARDLYVDVSDLLAAFRTINSLCQVFDQQPFQQKIDLVQRFSKIAKTSPQHRALAAVSIKLGKEAIEAGEYAVAKECCQTAVSSSRASADATLQGRAVDQLRRTEAIFDLWEASKAAETRLKDQANDPVANTQVGAFNCFVRRDWMTGLPKLSKSSDAELAAIVGIDVANPMKREEQLALGEQWLQYAEKQKATIERTATASRAVFWLEKAVASLDGLDRTAAEKTLVKANELACEADFRKLLSRKANGLEVDSKIDCRTATYPLKIKQTFDLRKSWLLSLEFQPPNLDGGPHLVFFWGDGRAGKDPLFVRLDGNLLWAACADCSVNQGHALPHQLLATDVSQWINVKFIHDALTGELEFYVNYRRVARESTKFTPSVDRGMPLCLGGTDGGDQRFVGQVRNVWLGNIP